MTTMRPNGATLDLNLTVRAPFAPLSDLSGDEALATGVRLLLCRRALIRLSPFRGMKSTYQPLNMP
jgi:hypothetical protein